jgi:DNA-3-methyladenine glycosylase
MTSMKLNREFYSRENTLEIARDLLGKLLVVPNDSGERVSGIIVETEAYLGAIDKACHSYNNRRTKRTETMYAVGGTAYVTLIYGMYYQFNVVTGAIDSPHAVLIRAVQPVEGIEIMRERRNMTIDKNLTSGPGKLCIAFRIDDNYKNADLLGDKIWLEDYKSFEDTAIKTGKRIGIDYAEEFTGKPWRFWVGDNQFVSRK